MATRTARDKASGQPVSTAAHLGAPSPDTSATDTTTFPPGDCESGLPASEAFHDITLAEIKRLSVTIEDLPYPLVIGDVNLQRLFGTETVLHPAQSHYRQQAQLQKLGASLAQAAGGGMPLAQFLDKKTGKVDEPLFTDIAIDDTYKFLQSPRIRLRRTDKETVAVELSDDARADLAAGSPVVVKVSSKGGTQLIRLLPKDQPSSVPMRNEYQIGPVAGFLRDPHIDAVDGGRIRLALNAHQLTQLADTGKTQVSVANRKITLRSQAESVAAPQAMVVYKIKNGGLPSDNQDDNEGDGSGSGPGGGSGSQGRGGGGGGGTTGGTGGGRPPKGSSTHETQGGADTSTPKSSRLQLALYLPWRHRWVLKGYSRGELLHSLALGPQEETTIEISSWDRRKRTFEDSAKSEFEQTSEFTDTSKDTQTVAREISTQNEFGASVGADVGFKVEVVDVSARTNFDAKTAVTDSSKNNLEILREAVFKATNKLKLERETKISESSEIGTEQKVTRKIRNPNLCHTLTLNYYEVLAHYDIVTELLVDDARLCIFDKNPLPLDSFNYKNVRYYESVLRRVLLVPALANGFDAAHKLVAQESLCEARARNDLCQATQVVTQAIPDDAVAKTLADLVKRIVQTVQTLRSSTIGAVYVPSPLMIVLPWPIFTLAISDKTSLQRYMYLRRASSIAPNLFSVISGIDGASVTASDVQNLAETLGAISMTTIGTPAIAHDKDAIYATLRDDLAVPPIPAVFTDIPEDAYVVDDAGLVAQIGTFLHAVRDAAQAAKTAEDKKAMADNQSAVKSDYSNKEIAEALEAQEALIEHLNRYRNYYRTCILTLMPFPDAFQERLTMLPMVERRVVGFDNNEIALPIRPKSDTRIAAFFDSLVAQNKSLTDMRTSQKVTLPTSGVHLETRLGECSACEEYIQNLRARDIRLKDVEIALKHEELAQQKMETQRRADRLTAHMLDDPVQRPVALRVDLDDARRPAGPPTTTPTPTP